MIRKYYAHTLDSFDGSGYCHKIEIPSIYEAKEGFWVNSEVKYTVAADCVTWIPPSRIRKVTTKEVADA